MESSLRAVILVSAVTVLLSVSLVYGIRYEFTPKTTPQTSSTQTAFGVNEQLGLKLTLTLEKTEYSLGEPINITLTITNVSNQTTTIGLSAYNDFDFQVYNGTHSVIYQYSDRWIGVAVPQIVIDETLEAGESLSENLVWNQTYPIPTGGSEGVPVSAGTYYIVGLIGSVLSRTNSTIETTPIQITI